MKESYLDFKSSCLNPIPSSEPFLVEILVDSLSEYWRLLITQRCGGSAGAAGLRNTPQVLAMVAAKGSNSALGLVRSREISVVWGASDRRLC
jgi:hypothetical protein